MIKLRQLGQANTFRTTVHYVPNMPFVNVTQASNASILGGGNTIKYVIGGLFAVAAVVLIAKHTGHLDKLTGGKSKKSSKSEKADTSLDITG